jgi:predicted esterase
MRLYLLFLFVLQHVFCLCQPTTPSDYGLKAFRIQDASLGTINFYVTSRTIDQQKPVLLVLDGSGHAPLALFGILNNSSFVANSFDTDLLQLADRFHVVLISKPGVPFCDTVRLNTDHASAADAFALLPPSPAYTHQAGLHWRVDAASQVINYICRRLPVDRSTILAYGYSEGAQVVAKLAVKNKKITHCASIFGSGLNQFYDFITAIRLKEMQGFISHDQAQLQTDSLYQRFADIYHSPHAPDKQWEGHSYQRWASFCSDIPLHNFVQLDIPIFIAAGTQDNSSPIYGLEYVRLEFLRLRKTNLSFHVYPTDHGFNETKIINGAKTVVNHKQDMLQDLFEWLQMNKR